jgi:hypothetical protein
MKSDEAALRVILLHTGRGMPYGEILGVFGGLLAAPEAGGNIIGQGRSGQEYRARDDGGRGVLNLRCHTTFVLGACSDTSEDLKKKLM